MQLSHLIRLPLLIREILDHYMYYLPHREMMKRLNEEYGKKVEKQYNCTVFWKPTMRIINMLITTRRTKSIIRSYCTKNIISRLPPKYRYTSGLNHPNGYKFKRLFPTSKMVFFDYITHNKKPNKSTEPYYNNPDY